MTGVVYCRVSSKEQIDGTSLESQQAACLEYARSKNIEVLKVFTEQGESAKFADRTQLLELIDFCRRNKGSVNSLLVWKVDRFARNVSDHFSVKATLGKYGVQIVSVTEPIDNNPEGKLMETILAGFAEFDNSIRAMRTVQGMRRKIQEGIFPWGPPFGYKSSVTGNEKKALPDLPDEPAFTVIRRAFTEFATGAYTQAEIGRLMESWGLAAAHGRSFAPQSLYQLFTNPFYAGILIDPWSGEEFPGKHVPVITREEFARVQRVIAARNRSVTHQKERDEFPLRGLVRCDACRHGLTAAFSRGRSRSYPYYLCGLPGCAKRGKSLPAAGVHAEFTSFLDEITPRPQLIQKIGERVIRMAEQNQRDFSLQRQRRHKQISQLETEINELIQMRAQNLLTNEEFLVQKRRLAAQRMALESQAKQTTDLARVRADIRRIMEPLSALRATWESLELPLRSRFDHLILPGGFVNGNIRTADMGLLFSFFHPSGHRVSSEVSFASEKLNLIVEEIQAFWNIMKGIEEPKPEPKRRFDNSHRNNLRWRKLNPGSERAAA
jgi:site-specific DNA recombinase